MSPSVEPAVFVREFLAGFFEAQLVNGLLPTDEYYDLIASFKDGLFTGTAERLFATSPDNLGTLNRPNVYIEVGMAHALDKPMLVSEYSGPSFKGRRKIADTGSVPSDLQGLLRIQYRGYQDLCRRIYFGLPAFLSRNGFHG